MVQGTDLEQRHMIFLFVFTGPIVGELRVSEAEWFVYVPPTLTLKDS